MGKVRKLALVAVLALAAAACGGDDDGDDAGGGAVDATEVDPAGELVVAVNWVKSQFDPHRTQSIILENTWMRPFYDRLLSLQPDLSIGPELATDYELSDDGLTLDLDLRDDVTFTSGAPFDAEAVKANIERAQTLPEATAVKAVFESVESVEVVDPHHVRLHLSEPDPTLVNDLSGVAGSMVDPTAFDTDLTRQPAGSGPFRLVSESQDEIVLERVEGHWNPERTNLARLTIRTLPDDNARLQALQDGSVDVAVLTVPQFGQARRLADSGELQLQLFETLSLHGMRINISRPGLDDPKVRKAISLALDRDALNEAIAGGEMVPTDQALPSGVVGHLEDHEAPARDLEQARGLLEEAGVDGLRLTAIVPQFEPHPSYAQVVQAQLAEIGIELELQVVAANVATPQFEQGEGDVMFGPISGALDPGAMLELSFVGPAGSPGGADPELRRLVDAAAAVDDDDERAEAYEEVNRYLVDNPVHAVYLQSTFGYLARPGVLHLDTLYNHRIGQSADMTRLAVAG